MRIRGQSRLGQRIKDSSGFSLLEVLIDVVLLVVAALAIATSMRMLSKKTVSAKDKAFATQKAIQMMDELRTVIFSPDPNQNGAISSLDAYDDGINSNFKLSTNPEVTTPSDPLSGNSQGGRLGWRFFRRISVLPIQADPSSRRVKVEVFANDGGPTVLAQAVSVISSSRNRSVPTQVYDVFYLCLENVPTHWMLDVETARAHIDDFMKDMASRNSGLDFRSHYIKRLSYGRDPFYTPFLNLANPANQLNVYEWSYIYPGNTTGGTYYPSAYFLGRINLDGTSVNGSPSATTSAGEYSLADQFNTSMRYPEEVAKYKADVANAIANNLPVPEISLRMLLEQMNSDTPSKSLGNIVLVNLHSEILPLPPIRNYSDPAKKPSGGFTPPPALAAAGDQRYERVVTHSENLTYPAGSAVKLRVYPYIMSGQDTGGAINPNHFPDGTAGSLHTDDVTVAIHANIPAASISIQKLSGDAITPYSWGVASSPADYTVTVGATTRILLKTVPFRHMCNGANCVNGGLDQNARLYQLEYIPCEVGIPAGGGFPAPGTAEDLASPGTGPKNTARYIITIAAGQLTVPSSPYAIETWLGNAANSTLPNDSTTYVWMGSSTTPATERYQFMGDPRHLPYHDVKMYHGYNWYFTDQSVIPAGGGPGTYDGYTKIPLAGGWPGIAGWVSDTTGSANRPGPVNIDLPRYYELYRQGLLRMNGIMSNISGVTASYFGLGGEIGLGATTLARSEIWDPSTVGTATVNENETSVGTYTGSRLVGLWNGGGVAGAGGWVSLPWLGELSPDNDWSIWQSSGNLPSIANAWPNKYYRANYQDFSPGGPRNPKYAEFNYADGPGGGHGPTGKAAERGSASLVNGITAGLFGGLFNHESTPLVPAVNPGALDVAGSSVSITFSQFFYSPFNYAASPFTITYPINVSRSPTEWADPIYSSQRTTTAILAQAGGAFPERYMTSPWNAGPGGNYMASAMVKVTSGTQVGYLFASGLTPGVGSQEAVNGGRLAVLGSLRGFMRAGAPNIVTGNIEPIPLVKLVRPAQSDQYALPVTIPINWVFSWTRWDRQRYTDDYPANFNPSVSIIYNVKYSKDSGKTWYFIQDPPTGAQAYAGIPDTSSAHTTFTCTPASPNCQDWDVSNATDFDARSYIVRVEAYRSSSPLDYTYHQQTVYITR